MPCPIRFFPARPFEGPTNYHKTTSQALTSQYESSLLVGRHHDSENADGSCDLDGRTNSQDLLRNLQDLLQTCRRHSPGCALPSLPTTWSKRSLRLLRAALEPSLVHMHTHRAVTEGRQHGSTALSELLPCFNETPQPPLLDCSFHPFASQARLSRKDNSRQWHLLTKSDLQLLHADLCPSYAGGTSFAKA